MIVHRFRDGQELAGALAERVGGVLALAIKKRGNASLAVSGGSTPGKFFDGLSNHQLSWEKVTVTLVDERFVDEQNERSNGRLVKDRLLNGLASKAQFVPLFVPDVEPDTAISLLEKQLPPTMLPFDAVILGMGSDGHTASFFPGGDNLVRAVDPDNGAKLCTMRASGAGEPRITFSLPVLVKAGFLALHIEGQDKLSVLETAKTIEKPDAMPIRHVLDHADHLETYWAP